MMDRSTPPNVLSKNMKEQILPNNEYMVVILCNLGMVNNIHNTNQEFQCAIKLEIYCKASLGKKTRNFDIEFFYFTNLIKRGEMQTMVKQAWVKRKSL